MKFEEILLLIQLAVMGVAALIGLKLNSRIIKLEQQTLDDDKKITALEKQGEQTTASMTNLTMRVLELDNKLIETNTYLKENLRYLTIIVDKHDRKIDYLLDNGRDTERKV